ncbi:hypothetical protein ABGB17_27545 [Sphaerisporangium sp. B11E5]|uniref:hypothetical protein n=1 Tax=Sphaerisporangium sp. B11E5 TaxID=3153563 RepID=UPI00325CB072
MTTPAARAGDDRAFPDVGIDAFLSHFIVAVRFHAGDRAGDLVTFSLPSAVQTVARSRPFVPAEDGERAVFRLPEGATLADEVGRDDFLVSPRGFFAQDREQVWLQILNLDARGETPFGPVRVILGETFKREYPDLFQPSFGAAQSLGERGFPARLFFSPNAVIETPLGAWKTRPKALVGAEIGEFPPIGSYPSLQEPVPLDAVESLRALDDPLAPGSLAPVATISALAHPIDAVVHDAQEAFTAIQRSLS